MKDVEKTILSQYANSPEILDLIMAMNAAISPDLDLERFYNEVFNVLTAETWGLDVWGRIVAIGRYVEIDALSEWFGFEDSDLKPFNQGTFYAPGVTNMHALANDAYRALILLKAMSNISDCSIPSLNRLLCKFFEGRGRAYIKETGVMEIAYVFELWLEPWERSLMKRLDIPPKPGGVGFKWLEVPPLETFGFAGSGLQPFNCGVFTGGYQDAF